MTADQVQSQSEELGMRIPPSKANAILGRVAKRGLALREGYPHRYKLVGSYHNSHQILLNSYRMELQNRFKSLESHGEDAAHDVGEVLREIFLGGYRGSKEIASVRSIREAQDISYEMWKAAKHELLIMASSGRWIAEDESLLRVLREKKARNPDFRVVCMLAAQGSISDAKKKEANLRVRNALRSSEIGGEVEDYVPRAMRMNVVDGTELEMFFWPEGHEKGRTPPHIFYTANKLVAGEMREMFYRRVQRDPPKLP